MGERIELDAADPRVVDRLVDGELTAAEERDLLAQLDKIPHGWRRCALAFLEARLWGQELRVSERPAAAAAIPVRPVTRASRAVPPSPRSGNWSRVLAMATIFLFAFTVGRFTPRPWDRADGPATGVVGPTQPVARSGGPELAPPAVPPAAQYAGARQPLGNLTLVDHSGQQIQVPVFDGRQQAADRVLFQPEPLPPDVLRNLKRHEVRRVQRLVPVQLGDGWQVVVPVQELDFVPVRETAY